MHFSFSRKWVFLHCRIDKTACVLHVVVVAIVGYRKEERTHRIRRPGPPPTHRHQAPMSIVPSLRRAAARGSCRDAVILSASRTPIGSFMGNLKGLSAPELGAVAIKSAVEKAGIDVKDIGEVLMGNVLSANIGQAPARQASIKAGIPYEAGCTTVNKVCSSGLKSVMLAAQSIILGNCDVAVAGGMESMSQVPFYMSKTPPSYGHNQMLDGILKDGLWDAFDDRHMGACAEVLAEEMKISRESQDNFCLESYARVAQATEKGLFKDEIAQVVIPQRRGDPIVIKDDEEFQRLKADKVKSLKPAFKKDGTVTAANASSLNDGAAVSRLR